MGSIDSPTQDPTTVNFFKIHEVTFDPKTGLWANDVLVNNKMTWKVQIPSDIKAGEYILRHEITALHYASRPNAGPEFLISCANVKIIGDGTAVPKDTVRFPGGYKPDMPGLKINVYHHENSYVSFILFGKYSLYYISLLISLTGCRFLLDRRSMKDNIMLQRGHDPLSKIPALELECLGRYIKH
jgi:hypothetical protein